MASVRSTPTATDALAQRKKILAEVSELTQKRDTVQREYLVWASALAAVKDDLKNKKVSVATEEEIKKVATLSAHKQRDTLQRDIRALEQRKTLKEAELDGLSILRDKVEKEILAKTAQNTALGGEIERKQAWFKTEHADNVAHIEGMRKELEDITVRVEQAREEIRDIDRKVSEKTEWILQEEKRLVTKGRDLAIYENRIRKAAEKVGIQIIL